MTAKRKKPRMRRPLRGLGKLAHRLRKQGRHGEAEEIYREILSVDPRNVYAMVGLGDLNRRMKRFKEAVSCYQRCVQIEQDNKYALAGLGDAYRGLQDLDKALSAWFQYLSLEPDDHKIMTRVADALRKKGDCENSKRYYTAALNIDPFDPYALMGLGHIALNEGDHARALSLFERLIDVSRDSVIGLTSAANIYRKRKSFEKAIDLYERALRIEPKNCYVWHGKADCLRGMGDHFSAIRAWQIAMDNGMSERIALTRIGDAYLNLNDLDRAQTSYENAMEIGYDKYAYLGMSKVHVRRVNLEKASAIFSMLEKKEPGDERILGEFRDFLSEYPEAAKSVQAAGV